MQIGMVGLGRMGASMVRRLMRARHYCVVYDQDLTKAADLADEGAHRTRSLDEFARALEPVRVVWIMLPAGDVTTGVIRQLAELLQPGDIVVDGGNSHFRGDLISRTVLGRR